jgi:hypothetical protein
MWHQRTATFTLKGSNLLSLATVKLPYARAKKVGDINRSAPAKFDQMFHFDTPKLSACSFRPSAYKRIALATFTHY